MPPKSQFEHTKHRLDGNVYMWFMAWQKWRTWTWFDFPWNYNGLPHFLGNAQYSCMEKSMGTYVSREIYGTSLQKSMIHIHIWSRKPSPWVHVFFSHQQLRILFDQALEPASSMTSMASTWHATGKTYAKTFSGTPENWETLRKKWLNEDVWKMTL